MVELRSGQELSGLDIRVAPKRPLSIAGIVTGLRAGVEVSVLVHKNDEDVIMVMDGEVSYGPSITAAADGSFQAKNLEPGKYSISASSGKGADKLHSTVQTVELSDTPLTGVVLSLLPPAKVTGSLKGADGAGRAVRLEPAGSDFQNWQYEPHIAPVARDGTFELDGLEPERFRLVLAPMPEDRYIKSVLPGDAEVKERGMSWHGDWPEMESELAPIIDLRQVSGLKLAIVFGPGATLAGNSAEPMVVLMPEGKTSEKDALDARAGADGRYEIRGLPPGKYRLLAVNPDSFDFDTGLEKALEKAKRIELKEGEKKTEDLDGK